MSIAIMEHRIDMKSSNGGEQYSNPPNNLVSVSAELYKVIKRQGTTSSDLDFTLKQLGRQHLPSEVLEHACCVGDTLLHMAVKFGKQDIAQRIVDEVPQLITKKNVKGDTPLHVAARSAENSSSLVEVILEASANHYPECSKEELCRKTNHFGNTPLHEAVIKSNLDGARILYSENKLVAHNYLNKENKSPFYVAVERRNGEIVDLLLHAPIVIHDEVQTEDNKNSESPVAAILQQTEDNNNSESPIAAILQQTEDNNNSESPVAAILQQTKDKNKCKSPLAAILRINPGERKKTSCLWTHGRGLAEKPVTQPNIQRTESSTKDFLHILDRILRERPELKHMKDEKGSTPLHWAALLGHLEGVRKLLDQDSASALEWNEKGYLPIHLACKKDHVSVVKEILKKVEWLDPLDLLNQKGQNILHMAAKNGKHEVVKFILREKKLDKLLNEKDNKGNTPLHSASKYLHPKLLSSEILLYAGTPLSENGKLFGNGGSKRPQVQWIKDHASTLMLVTILVATVTFSAGFTVPGGLIDSDDKDITNIGMATLKNELMFKVFIICDVVALYSSTFAAFILLWAKLGDFHMAVSATHFALLLAAVALVTMSTAFMAAIYLIVRKLCWLAHTVIITGIIFLSMFLLGFALLIFPTGAPIPLLNYIARVIFRMMIPFSGSYSKVKERKLYKKSIKQTQAQTQGGEQQQSDTVKYMLKIFLERLQSDTFKYMLERY
ncbi:hypothetical protein L6164_007053 [Bauhinia variegata]|uniref:Uncharacterized protein n=1 Tax=Bauhinia variegata TaxID=167791 RepID=A0ACB9PXT8_BAUVA|nr:hypothetical protein L6164_007053 [Bauhinia variegata]